MNEALLVGAAVVRISLGIVFAAAAASKLLHPAQFRDALTAHHNLSRSLARIAAAIVTLLEATLAGALLSGQLLQVAMPASAALLTMFGVVSLRALRTGRRIPCLCFDTASHEYISRRTVLRTALLLAAQLGLIGLGSDGIRALSSAQFLADLTWAVSLVTVASWVLSGNDLVAVVRTGSTPSYDERLA